MFDYITQNINANWNVPISQLIIIVQIFMYIWYKYRKYRKSYSFFNLLYIIHYSVYLPTVMYKNDVFYRICIHVRY